MAKVNHQKIYQQVVVDQDEAGFLSDLERTLTNIQQAARNVGATVDWSTLSITPGDEFETRNGLGEILGVYQEPSTIAVDTVWIEQG